MQICIFAFLLYWCCIFIHQRRWAMLSWEKIIHVKNVEICGDTWRPWAARFFLGDRGTAGRCPVHEHKHLDNKNQVAQHMADDSVLGKGIPSICPSPSFATTKFPWKTAAPTFNLFNLSMEFTRSQGSMVELCIYKYKNKYTYIYIYITCIF